MNRHGKTNRGVILVLSFSIWVVVGCAIGPAAREMPNSVDFLKRYYGADDKMIEALTGEYNVPVSDISQFGPYPFPINYIRSQIGWGQVDQGTASAERPIVYRRDVEAIVKGYISRCRWANTVVFYLFYSDRLAPRSIFDKGTSALVMEVRYRLDTTIQGESDEQILEEIGYFDLGDDAPFNWSGVAELCIPPARTD